MAGDDDNGAAANQADPAARRTAMEATLAALSGQLQQLIAAGQPQGQPPPQGPPAQPHGPPPLAPPRRRLDPSVLDKLSADVDLVHLESWKRRWNGFARLGGLSDHPVEDQAALLRLALDPSMQQVVEIALGILPTDNKTPAHILEKITEFIRAKRNVALDRAAFRECRQGATETFDEFYMRLKNLAGPADLCLHCVDQQLATGIMTGVRDMALRQKLLAISPFPTAEDVVKSCRIEESARSNAAALNTQLDVSAVHSRPQHHPRQQQQQQHHAQQEQHSGGLVRRVGAALAAASPIGATLLARP